jgi:hypothetical protein
VEISGNVDARRRLAEELFDRGQYDAAIEVYQGGLKGIFEHDPTLLLGAARELGGGEPRAEEILGRREVGPGALSPGAGRVAGARETRIELESGACIARPPPGEEIPMQFAHRVARYALISAAAIILVACASQKEPAQRLMNNIETAVAAASSEAAKYIPDRLADVQRKLIALKASFAKQDYAAVVTGGPAVLNEAQGLATAAAAKKDEILKARNDEWAALSAALPPDLIAVQNRVDLLSKKSSKKAAAGIDLAAAKDGLSEANSLWSKAQAAFAAGTMEEAVNTAKDVKARVEALANALKMDLPAAAAAQ